MGIVNPWYLSVLTPTLEMPYSDCRGGSTLLDVDHEGIFLRTFILFTQASDAVAKYANAHFYRKNSLSAIKFMVLPVLSVNGGSMRPSEIAEWTLRERHNITTLIVRLERDELIRTERGDKDKRFKNVILTDKGRSVLAETLPTAREIVNPRRCCQLVKVTLLYWRDW